MRVIKPDGPNRRTDVNQPLTLQPGWNQIGFRGYCVGYSNFHAGLTFNGPAEKLWTLQLSATPPAAAGGEKTASPR